MIEIRRPDKPSTVLLLFTDFGNNVSIDKLFTELGSVIIKQDGSQESDTVDALSAELEVVRVKENVVLIEFWLCDGTDIEICSGESCAQEIKGPVFHNLELIGFKLANGAFQTSILKSYNPIGNTHTLGIGIPRDLLSTDEWFKVVNESAHMAGGFALMRSGTSP